MKSWQIENQEKIVLVEQTLERKEGEVKLKLAHVALSSSDVSYFAGDHGAVKVPGHSAVGFVSDADETFGMKLGTRVVVSPYIAVDDGSDTSMRVMGIDMDGLLQDFACIPEGNVYALPDGIPDEEAIFADYIALADKVFGHVKFEKGDYIVVVGAGTLGLILSQLALYYQAVPILVDYDIEKLTLAEHWGVYYTINPTYDNLEKRIAEITGGRMSDFAVYAATNIAFGTALRLVKDGGEVVIAGYTTHGKHQIEMDTVLKKQLTITGISNGEGSMATAINLLANRIVKTEGIVGKHVDFEAFPDMFRETLEYPYQYNKIVIDI